MSEALEKPQFERPMYQPGWHHDISNEDYHASLGASSSRLKTLIEHTPAHLEHERKQPPRESTKNMVLGTAVHSLILEPKKFDEDVAVAPVVNLRTSHGKAVMAEFAEVNAGKTVITEIQFEQAHLMAKSALEHPIAGLLLSDIVPETSVYWWYRSMDADDKTQYKEMLKVRPDAISRAHPCVIDVKTTVDGSYTGFIKSIQNFYYHVSAAMYLEGINQCKPLLEEMQHFAYTKFIFVCVENTAPYLTSIYELSPEYLEIGKTIYRNCLHTLRTGRENDWPGFPEEVRVIEPPGWARRGHIV